MGFQPAVIKLGGSVLERLHPSFFQGCGQLMEEGIHPVIVHGGGPEISRVQQRLGFTARFVDGLRVTDDSGMKTVEMVLAGRVNKRLVADLQAAGHAAVGLSGVDGGLLEVKQRTPALGWVGDITAVRPRLLVDLMNAGWIPVVASLGADPAGQRYNVNADTAAGAITRALKAERLIMVTDVPGIHKGDGKKVLPRVTPAEIQQMIQEETITGGMIPKVEAALEGLTGSVDEVIVTDGSQSDCLTQKGTRIVKEVATSGPVSDICAK
ncbi:N-acetylglutamate kinase [Melghirimyces thermohalophilus]|uniref:Acetylglutamate kinase n=1 Tax=Melghirimyces thermohalophilus TaxID=1236220 RepID=A0A1G6QS39_9BACL|nr:acetylglutamate kinase [Melghirimyces thermohalophilus]SDC94507.1 N-acetylglutamate kinase [Melghirimyces thermohalophilus]